MTVVDIIVIFVVFLSALFSLLRGFVKEAISLGTWILAIWVSATFAPRLATVYSGAIESEAVQLAAGFATLFLLTLMMGALVNYMVTQFVKKTGLSGANRVLGVAFGFLRGILIIVVFVVIGGMTPLPQQQWWQTSLLLKRSETLAMQIQEYLPEDIVSIPEEIMPVDEVVN